MFASKAIQTAGVNSTNHKTMAQAKLITKRSLIKEVYQRWSTQYADHPAMSDKHEITKKLSMLNLDTCSEQDVSNIIGNTAWTHIRCNGCDKTVDAVVFVGEEPDYDSASAMICAPCLLDAVSLILPTHS